MITKIDLLNFKIHKKKTFNFSKNIVVIHGLNGVGKTSVLEAISIFTAGKGVFNVNNEELISCHAGFFIAEMKCDLIKLKVQFQSKKNFFINENPTKSSNILEVLSILGLTPYTALAFWQDVTLRRKIMDRIVLQHTPIYGQYYREYLKALKQRNALINNGTFNNKWASFLDPIIKENGLKINDIREKTFNKFKDIPQDIAQFLQDEMEVKILPSYQEQREILSSNLSENFVGPHLSKFYLTNNKKESLSTGHQRKLLLAFILTTLSLNSTENVLLLDDILANLDHETIEAFLTLLSKQNIQTFITNIDPLFCKNIDIENIFL